MANGGKPNDSDYHGTCLMAAACFANPECVRALVLTDVACEPNTGRVSEVRMRLVDPATRPKALQLLRKLEEEHTMFVGQVLPAACLLHPRRSTHLSMVGTAPLLRQRRHRRRYGRLPHKDLAAVTQSRMHACTRARTHARTHVRTQDSRRHGFKTACSVWWQFSQLEHHHL